MGRGDKEIRHVWQSDERFKTLHYSKLDLFVRNGAPA